MTHEYSGLTTSGEAGKAQAYCTCGFTTATAHYDDAYKLLLRHLELQDKIEEAVALVRTELERAMKKHPTPFYSAHDGYAKLLEEVDEAWDEIKADDPHMTRKEMSHVGAMALRFLIDVPVK